MPSYLAHLFKSFPVSRGIRQKALFLAVITTAILFYVLFRASQLNPLFYTPFPQSIEPLAFYELGYFQQSAKSYRAMYKRAGENGAFSENPLLKALLSEDPIGTRQAAASLLSANPDDLQALKALTEVALQEHDIKSAGELTKRMLAVNEDDADALVLAALVATLNHSYGEAIGLLNLALRTGDSGNLLTLLDVLEMAGQLRDSNEPPLCLLAHFYRYLRIYDSAKGQWAVRTAEQAIAAGDHPAEAYVTIGIALEKRGLRQRALESFQKATQIDPSYGMAYRWAAGIYAKSGDHSHEYLMNRAAFQTNPSDHLFRDDLYYELRDRKEFAQLAKAMQQAIDQDAGDIVALSYVISAHRQLGHEEQAQQYSRQALPLEPRGPQAYDAKAWILQQMGRLDETEQLLKESIRLDGYRPEPYRALARLYQKQGRVEEAFSTYERVLLFRGGQEGQKVLEFCAGYERTDLKLAEACRDRLFGKQR
jgi:tetratricopeptide (TPR) repeat protein